MGRRFAPAALAASGNRSIIVRVQDLPRLGPAAWLAALALLTPLVRFESLAFGGATIPRSVWFRAVATAGALLLLVGFFLRALRARERRDPVLLAFAAFVAVLLVAAFLGVAPKRSLWGSWTRMWGVVAWGYLLVHYLVVRGLVRREEWPPLLLLSLAVSALVSLVGIAEAAAHASDPVRWRIVSTIGNPGFLAVYLLLHLGIGALLLTRARTRGERVAVGALMALDLAAFALADSVAGWAGLAAGTGTAAVLYLAGRGSRPARAALAGVSFLAVGTTALLLAARATPLSEGIPLVGRLAAISPSEASLGGRLAFWQAAARGARESPLLGVGPENFGILFSRYFSPELYGVLLTTYADRAHDVFLEQLSTAGAMGLAAYLALWVVFFAAVRRAAEPGRLGAAGAVILASTGVAYLVYMVFWFEDLSSMVVVVSLLAFASSFAGGGPLLAFQRGDRAPARVGVAVLAALVAAFTFYQWGARHLLAVLALDAAQRAPSVEARLRSYDRALALGMPEGDVVAQRYASYLESMAPEVEALGADPYRRAVVDGALQSALSAMSRNVDANPESDVWRLERSGLLRFAAIFYRDARYHRAAVDDLRAAIALSPRRIRHHHMLAETFLMTEETDSARAALARAREIHPGFGETELYLAKLHYVEGDPTAAAEALFRWMADATYHVNAETELYAQVARPLEERGDVGRAARLYLRYLQVKYAFHTDPPPAARVPRLSAADRDLAGRLPILFLRAGDPARAEEVARLLAARSPGDAAAVGRFVSGLRAGRGAEWAGRETVLGVLAPAGGQGN